MDTNDLKVSSAKMVTGTALAWYSAYTLQEWVAIVTIAYVVLQMGLLIPKYYGLMCEFFDKANQFFKKTFGGKYGKEHKKRDRSR